MKLAWLPLIPLACWGSWPAGLSVQLEPCAKRITVGAETYDVAHAEGRVKNDGPQGWHFLYIGARVKIETASGIVEKLISLHIPGVLFGGGFTERFNGSFGYGRLGPEDRILNCEAFFQRGFHAERKTKTITLHNTPIAKDSECFADLVRASPLKGIELRKRLSELLSYGCVSMADQGYVVAARTDREIDVDGKATQAALVRLEKPYGKTVGPPGYVGYTLPSSLGPGEVLLLEEIVGEVPK